MGLIIVLIILSIIFSVGFYFIPISSWFMFLWVPVAIILAAVCIVLFVLAYLFLCKKDNPKGKFRHFLLRNACFLTIKYNHIKPTIVGLENINKDDTYVIYANHKSMLDPVIMYHEMHIICTAIGKSDLFTNKIMIAIKDTFGAISLNRNNTREAVLSINEGIEKLKGGLSIIIFPEGGILTRDEETMSGLRAGAYKLATKSKRSILPVSIIGSSNIAKLPRRKRKNVKVIVHKPINYEDFKDMNTNEIGLKVETIINGDFNEK